MISTDITHCFQQPQEEAAIIIITIMISVLHFMGMSLRELAQHRMTKA